MEIKAENNISAGIISVVAPMRVFTKYLNGLVADTSMASICSVTRIDPNSAPMPEPTLPALINAVTSGASDLTTAMATNDGNQDCAPNSDKEGRDCLVNTTPVIKAVMEISARER